MPVTAILFDAHGVVYQRPEVGIALETLLDHLSLKPRHPTIVRNALRAAQFDASVGRIPLDDYFNAVLRIHGIHSEQALTAGREALRFDATRLELPHGVAAQMRQFYMEGYLLGAVANTPFRSSDETSWLMRLGIPSEIWAVYRCSSESRTLAPDPAMMQEVIEQFHRPAHEIALVSRERTMLEFAAEAGLIPVAYQAVEALPGLHVVIDDLRQLPPALH
jgi:hypothetical protein